MLSALDETEIHAIAQIIRKKRTRGPNRNMKHYSIHPEILSFGRALTVSAVLGSVLLSTVVLADTPTPLSAKDLKQQAAEIKLGQDTAAEVAKTDKFVTDKTEVDRVNRIGQRLAAVANTTQYPAGFGNDKVFPFTWHFTIINDPDVNAFSIPGGWVYINSGLLKLIRSDDELAGVLGHEITHSAHHHAEALAREQSKLSFDMAAALIAALIAHVPTTDIVNGAAFGSYAQMGVLNTQYSQRAEKDADHGGVILMQKAGFNPVAMLTFMNMLGDIERKSPSVELGIFRDHPYTEDRVTAITSELASLNVAITPAAIREATNTPKVTCVADGTSREKLIFGADTSNPLPLVSLADPGGVRAASAAQMLNDLLANGLRLGDVHAVSDTVVADNQVILTLTQADAGNGPGATPELMAASVRDAIQKALWAQSIADNAPDY